MSQEKKSLGRRTFLVGLFTGAGVAAALGATAGKVTAKTKRRNKRYRPEPTAEPVLYRRSKEAERYYKTLHT